MRFAFALRILAATSLASFALAACGDDDTTGTQSTPNGKAGAAGAAGQAAGGTAGKGGSTAGSGGSTAGSGGSTAGSGGATAGSAGTSAGNGGSTAGSAGTSAGNGGSAGASAGSAGASAGNGGASAGNGGAGAGAAGASAGNGGSSAGNGGSSAGSAGAGGQSVAQPQCGGIVDTCKLHDDCCNCLALGPNEKPPVCDVSACKASACELLGKPQTACNAGQCTLTLGCGAKEVTCKQIAPTCAKGLVPEVKDKCWTGKCVDVRDCSRVSTCDDCKAAGLTCVTISTNSAFPIVHCIDLPPACSEATCGCLGPAVCTGGANLCSDDKTGVTCSCPNC